MKHSNSKNNLLENPGEIKKYDIFLENHFVDNWVLDNQENNDNNSCLIKKIDKPHIYLGLLCVFWWILLILYICFINNNNNIQHAKNFKNNSI